jgi:hypothetical protein
MKTKELFLGTLILTTSISALEISKNKTFESITTTNIKKTNLYVKYINNSDSLIEKEFSNIIQYAKDSKICKGGKYTIKPNIKTSRVDGKYISTKYGYIGNINFNCKFENNTKYEIFLDNVKRNKDLDISQGSLEYIVSPDKKEDILEDLENKGYRYAKEYKKYLNKIFSNCSISNINLSTNHYYPRAQVIKSEMQSSSVVSSPIENNFIQKLSVNYKFKCDG